MKLNVRYAAIAAACFTDKGAYWLSTSKEIKKLFR
jgi:hypothetical protein